MLGTESALRHLHRLGQKAQDQKRIRPFAQGALNRIAEERGLTPEQLADRLVPDLGLDASGGMTLDYGQRRFVVGFDEQLKPFVTDQDGKLRKILPKPGVKDDSVLAPAAYQRFADLKKEVRTLAVEHPLLWHIARRLIWSAEADGRTTSFRIAEDRTLADVDDNEYTLPDTARIALPRPLILSGTVDAWSQVLSDYEIIQPFPQLDRAIHALTEEERPKTRLERFESRTVHFGRIIGMTSRGWELGEKETGGFRHQIMCMTPDDRHIMIQIEPGIRVISPDEFPEQEIREVMLLTGRYSGKAHPFGELDPVTASELLAELTRIAETTAQ